MVFATIFTPATARADATDVAITHTPPPTSVAGTDLTIIATTNYVCGANQKCGPLSLTVDYQQPWGGRGSVVVGDTDGGGSHPGGLQTWTLSIPGSAVRYPSIAYRLLASQKRCASLLCDPVTQGTVHMWYAPTSGDYPDVSVLNQVNVQYNRVDGTPASNAMYDLVVFKAGTPPTATTVTSGHVGADGSLTLNLNALYTSDVAAAAAANSGLANYMLNVYDNYGGVSYWAPYGFTANWTNHEAEIGTAGVSITPGTAPTEIALSVCDPHQTQAASCIVPDPCPYGTSVIESAGTDWGEIGQMHVPWGLQSAKFGYGRDSSAPHADSTFQVAVNYGSGWAQGHSGTTEVATEGLGQDFPLELYPSAETDRVNMETQFTFTVWAHYQLDILQRCIKTEEASPNQWLSTNPGGDPLRVRSQTPGDTHDDCWNLSSCHPDGSYPTIISTGTLDRSSSKAITQSAGFCFGYVISICVDVTSGYSSNVHLAWNAGNANQATCNQWYYYYKGKQNDTAKSPVIYADPGKPGGETYTSGGTRYPKGCGPNRSE
jgi:hypothetical protein